VREVPAFEAHELEPRRSRFVIGVPVLDEGDRLRRQLAAMAAEPLDADVVVADGGSADGSTEPAFLRSVGARALLVKTGPGRLSAQLRMLFAWALDEGYEGVIAIDGNGKDGLDGLVRVREGLEAGYDLVQGSRYRPGGRHENTPLDRSLGVRLLHAPLLSLAAGFRYTDTTNGLRGWSATLLRDPRVDPFRDVFDTYNLHYYLSVRAPRLGYRVCEVPVSRAYPRGEATPTKIRGFRSRLHLLKLLVLTAAGAYNP
jgi:dolichol-phosphate mannosyltransferase